MARTVEVRASRERNCPRDETRLRQCTLYVSSTSPRLSFCIRIRGNWRCRWAARGREKSSYRELPLMMSKWMSFAAHTKAGEEQGTAWSSCAAQQKAEEWALQVHPGDPTVRSQSEMTLTLVERPLQPGPVCGTDSPLFAVEGSWAVGMPCCGSFHQQIITLGVGGLGGA